MNCLLVMKIKWSLDINIGAVERSEAARVRRLAGATVVGDDVIASTGYMKKQSTCQPSRDCPENCPSVPASRKLSECPGIASQLASFPGTRFGI